MGLILTCCVTGHRILPEGQSAYVRDALAREVDAALGAGYTRFFSGFAQGADLLFTREVARRRREDPAIELEAAIPYRGRWQRLQAQADTRALLAACTRVHILSEGYAPYVFMLRNRFMIAHSQRLIAVYDGRQEGGTVATLAMALKAELEIREILLPPEAPKAAPR